MMEILLSINWIDLLVGCLMARCIYIGAKQGIVVEFFKFLGTICAFFIAVHYFTPLAVILVKVLSIISRETAELFIISLIWLIALAIFSLVRSGWLVILRTEGQSALSKYGGVLLGTFRGLLTSGIVIFMILVSGQMPVIQNVRSSLIAWCFADMVPNLYDQVYEEAVYKLFPKEERNKEVRKYRLVEFFKEK